MAQLKSNVISTLKFRHVFLNELPIYFGKCHNFSLQIVYNSIQIKVQTKNTEGLYYKIMQFITVYISMYKKYNIHVELSIVEIQDDC